MMGLKICLGIFFVLFLFLLIPIRYRFILEIKHLVVTVEFIFGLCKKTMELPGKKRERTADADEKIEELLFADEERPAAAQRAEMILTDETEPEKAPEEKMKENKAEKHKESADEGKGEKKNILRCGSSCGLLSITDWRKIFLRLSQRFWRTACRGNGIFAESSVRGIRCRPACLRGWQRRFFRKLRKM